MMTHATETRAKTKLVIGIGNPFRGDDGIGRLIAQKLKERSPHGITVAEDTGEAGSLMSMWDGVEEVILIDAVFTGSKPGTVFRFDVSGEPLPEYLFKKVSTHSFGLPEALELARALKFLPPSVTVYGVEGKCFDEGTTLSPETELAAEELIATLLTDLSISG